MQLDIFLKPFFNWYDLKMTIKIFSKPLILKNQKTKIFERIFNGRSIFEIKMLP